MGRAAASADSCGLEGGFLREIRSFKHRRKSQPCIGGRCCISPCGGSRPEGAAPLGVERKVLRMIEAAAFATMAVAGAGFPANSNRLGG